jgi:hypothetical protein
MNRQQRCGHWFHGVASIYDTSSKTEMQDSWVKAHGMDAGNFECSGSYLQTIRRIDSIRFDWIRFDWIGFDSIRLDWIRFDSIRLDSIRFDWIGFDSIAAPGLQTPKHTALITY